MSNWCCRWLHVFLRLIFCWSLQVAGPATCRLHAQESAPAVAEYGAIGQNLNAALANPVPLGTTEDALGPKQSAAPVPTSAGREISWRRLPANVLHDQKDM